MELKRLVTAVSIRGNTVLSFVLRFYFHKVCKPTFTLLISKPKIVYYTTALDQCETFQVERKENLMNLLREDRDQDAKNV